MSANQSSPSARKGASLATQATPRTRSGKSALQARACGPRPARAPGCWQPCRRWRRCTTSLHGPPPPGAGEQRRNQVLNRVYATLQHAGDRGPLTRDDLAFLEQRLARSEYKLAQRLEALVECDVSSDLRTVLTRLVDPLPDGRQTPWEAMGTVRNRLTHGRIPVPSARQVGAVVRFAHTLATAIALRLLDVPDTALQAGIEHRRWSAL